MRGRAFRMTLVVLAVVSLVAGIATSSQGSEAPRTAPRDQTVLPVLSAPGAPRDLFGRPARPNIVFILTDDLSTNLLRFMPHVEAMQRDGLTFNNYFVSDSLCCPSRSSIFTGNFPHDTRVFNNVGRRGGFRQFYDRGEEEHTFAVALQNAGYRTAMMGKYLNGYG
jgi:N-acetylglucosamine-6-sulfatase